MQPKGTSFFFRSANRDSGILREALDRRLKVDVQAAVDKISEPEFQYMADEKIIQAVEQDLRIEKLSISRSEGKPFTYPGYQDDESGTPDILITGKQTLVVHQVPFKGWRRLWWLEPDGAEVNPPKGKVLSDSSIICIEAVINDHEHQDVLQYVKYALDRIEYYISLQADRIDGFNDRLHASVVDAVSNRRKAIDSATDLKAKLQGI